MASALGPLAFWEGYEAELVQLLLYAVGLAVYAVLVGAFYITLSQRDLRARAAFGKGPGWSGLFVVLPFVSFGLFLVLSIAFFFLAKSLDAVPEAQRVRDLMTISMALVLGVRVTSYISEHAAADLAKLVPLGLLGVLLLDPGYLTVDTPFVRMAMLPGALDIIGRYLIIIIVVELVLRAGWVLTGGRARERRAVETAKVASAPPQHR